MNNLQDQHKFEFALTMGSNIICQRYFSVRDYNPKAKKSMNLYRTIKNICENISLDLKNKCSAYHIENQNFFYGTDNSADTNNGQEEYFLLTLKYENEVFMERVFPAHFYHPKVRYSVDIRPKLKHILSDISESLSEKKLETTFLSYNL